MLRHVREHGVPAIGFVNENKLLTDRMRGSYQYSHTSGAPAAPVARSRHATAAGWTSGGWSCCGSGPGAGLELGNHGYSHIDFHTHATDAYVADVARGDSVTRIVLAEAGKRPGFFRYPFLHAGRSLDDRRRFEASLAERGCRAAPVTIDNNDYLFAAAYDLAPADSGRRSVADEYLRYMEAVTAYYEQQSRALFGRETPQVLLLHANHLNADHLGRLAELYARRGYAFVPLERALEDPAYATADAYTGPAGPSWIHRWALTEGRSGGFFAEEPEVPGWVQALARRRENPRTGARGG